MRQRGFTLLEIMIVVVIIGIVTASVVSVAFGDRKSEKLQQEASRLKAVINLAQEEAVLESRIYALGIWQKGYGFYVPDSEGWALLDRRTDKRLGERKLPEEMELEIALEGIGVVLEIEPPEKPQIFILSSGEMTAFEIDFRFTNTDGEPERLAYDPLGRLLANDES